MCLPCVPSLWAIVTSFKSLHSLRLSNILFTYHSHTMNSYYNCSQYVVIIQLVSWRLCKFSFVLWKPFFWEYFSDFFPNLSKVFVLDSSTKMKWRPFLGLTSTFFMYFSEFYNISGFSKYFSKFLVFFQMLWLFFPIVFFREKAGTEFLRSCVFSFMHMGWCLDHLGLFFKHHFFAQFWGFLWIL